MTRVASFAAVVLLTAAVVGCALALITAQYRARNLFARLETEQQTAQQLDAEANRLRVDLGRAAQPAAVEAAALALGLRRIDLAHTLLLPIATVSALPVPAAGFKR